MGGKGGGGFFSGLQDMFTKSSSWKGKNSWVNNIFDPGRHLLKMEESTPKVKDPIDPVATAEKAKALEDERRRISTGSRQTSRRADALSSSVGKRVLGGTY